MNFVRGAKFWPFWVGKTDKNEIFYNQNTTNLKWPLDFLYPLILLLLLLLDPHRQIPLIIYWLVTFENHPNIILRKYLSVGIYCQTVQEHYYL